MKRLGDNCDKCSMGYQFDPSTDYINLYDDERFNHIFAVCPHCHNTVVIFIAEDAMETVLENDQVPVHVLHDASGEVSEMYEKIVGGLYHQSGTSYDLPEPPRDQLMELWNWMRHFGGECGVKCLFPECGAF